MRLFIDGGKNNRENENFVNEISFHPEKRFIKA